MKFSSVLYLTNCFSAIFNPYFKLMETILLDEFVHLEKAQIGIRFGYDREMINHLKKLEGVSWSNTFGCFYIQGSKLNLDLLFKHLNKRGYYVDYSNLDIVQMSQREAELISAQTGRPEILDFKRYLYGQRYSESTIETYAHFTGKFLKYHRFKKNYTLADVDRFVEKEIASKKYSISSHRQCISALKHYFELTKQEAIDTANLKRPDKSKYLPGFLARKR